MKKVLFATTALVASAGIASAQGVEVSGSAEMGIKGGDGIETQFYSGIDVSFTMSGETDNGLTFGAKIDLDDAVETANRAVNANGGAANTAQDTADTGANELADYTVFISGNFGTLTMGDTDGAFDWALTEVGIGGALADDHTSHSGFSGNAGLDGTYDGQIVRYEYSFGDFAFAVSAELDDLGVGDPVFGIGGKYSGDLSGVTLGVGIGYQSDGTDDIVGVSLSAELASGFQGIVNFSELTTPGVDTTHIGIGVGYSNNGLTVGVNYGQFDRSVGADSEGFGLAVNYDLGGGAEVQFGYGTSETGGVTDFDQFSLGIAMSF